MSSACGGPFNPLRGDLIKKEHKRPHIHNVSLYACGNQGRILEIYSRRKGYPKDPRNFDWQQESHRDNGTITWLIRHSTTHITTSSHNVRSCSGIPPGRANRGALQKLSWQSHINRAAGKPCQIWGCIINAHWVSFVQSNILHILPAKFYMYGFLSHAPFHRFRIIVHRSSLCESCIVYLNSVRTSRGFHGK